MHQIDGAGHIGNRFTEGDPLTGTPATVVTDDWLNEVQEELINLLVAASISPTKGVENQLVGALFLKIGGTLTGNLTVQKTDNADIIAESTANSSNSSVQAKSKEAGGTPIITQISGDPVAGAVGAFSNHPLNIITNNTTRMSISAAGVLTKMPLAYESSQQTITAASIATLAHWITGVIPRNIWVVLVCQTAEYGYVSGEEVSLGINQVWDSGARQETGVGWSADTTNIQLIFGQEAPQVYRKDGGFIGQSGAVTPANWKIIVRALP